MKNKVLILTIVLMFLNLAACEKKDDYLPLEGGNKEEIHKEDLEKDTHLDFDFKTREEILNYLVGHWQSRSLYLAGQEASLRIGRDLGVEISFYDSGETREESLTGSMEILMDKGMLTLEVGQKTYEYKFRHKTFYNGKYLMALYHIGEEGHLLDRLFDGYARDTIDEMFFEKNVDIDYESRPKKNSSFKGAIWEYENRDGLDKFWIGELDDSFQHTDGISNLYGFSKDLEEDLLEYYYEDIFLGYAYVFETDENGDITSLSMEGYLHYLTGGQPKGDIGY